MERLTEFFIGLVRDLFADYGYLVVFLGTALENTLFLGVIIPGAFLLLLAGLSAHDGLIDARLGLILAVIGTSAGDTLSYLAGRFGWRRALRHAEQLPFMGTVRTALLRRTGLFVLAYHFMGYTRILGPVTAGAIRLPFKRWWVLDLMGATIWVTAYFMGGYLLGVLGISLDTANENAKLFDRLVLILAVVTIASLWVLRRRSKGHALPAGDGDEGEADSPVEPPREDEATTGQRT